MAEMNTQTVFLGLHGFSFRHHFLRKPGFDAFAFIDAAARLGVCGVHISINDDRYRWAGGTSVEGLRAVGAAARQSGMYLEADTSGTDPARLAKLMHACQRLGADRLRTYTVHRGRPDEKVEATVRDLRAAAPVAADLGVAIVLENHEEFTGREIREIVEAVDHPSVAALYDFGNSMMVMEDPLEAAKAMAPFVRTVHVKDQVVVLPLDRERGDTSAEPLICGVPIGRGRIDIAGILGYLLATSRLDRVCVQSVYGYIAPVKRHIGRFAEVRNKHSAFVPVDPHCDESVCLLDSATLADSDLHRVLNYELSAVALGVGKVRELLGTLGFAPDDSAAGVYVRCRAEGTI